MVLKLLEKKYNKFEALDIANTILEVPKLRFTIMSNGTMENNLDNPYNNEQKIDPQEINDNDTIEQEQFKDSMVLKLLAKDHDMFQTLDITNIIFPVPQSRFTIMINGSMEHNLDNPWPEKKDIDPQDDNHTMTDHEFTNSIVLQLLAKDNDMFQALDRAHTLLEAAKSSNIILHQQLLKTYGLKL
jgi:hypothetical protein